MRKNSLFSRKIVLAIYTLFSASFSCIAQSSLEDAKAPILAARDLYYDNADSLIDTVIIVKGYPEFWAMDQLDCRTEAFRIFWQVQTYLYSELFLIQGGRLIYAAEDIKMKRSGHYTQNVWGCQYFINDGKVIDYTSIGHGKTEDDNWDPEEVFALFNKRKAELEKLRE